MTTDTGESGTCGPPEHAVRAGARALRSWRDGQRPDGGYLIPYRYAADTTRPRAPAWLVAMLEDATARMTRWLEAARQLAEPLRAIERRADTGPGAPRFDQDWFTGLDACAAYVIARTAAPRRIVEVGSGHSTRFLAQAVRDGGHGSALVSIDPQPRREIDALCTAVVRRPLDEQALALLSHLGEEDLLFIDGSHVLMPGTDIDLLASHVLPVLPVGCLVHIHDMFIPDDYPPGWFWRGYNEQSLVVALLGSGRYRIEMATAWLRRHRPELLDGVRAPCHPTGFESSLWLRVVH